MELRELLGKLTTNAYKFESDINEKIVAYNEERILLQSKLDKLFDEQVTGKVVDSKEIDKLSAEIVRINGLISALERQAKNGFVIPKTERQTIIKVAAEEHLKNYINTLSETIRLEEINKQLWDLMDEQREIYKKIHLNGSDNLRSTFKYYSLLNEDESKDITAEAEKKADIMNNPECIKLREKLEASKSGYPLFWNRYI